MIVAFFILSTNTTNAQTEWTGTTTTFTKSNNADWTLEANQDRITDNVWITRANNSGIFNIATETEADGSSGNGISPADTEWAFGTISDGVSSLTFTTWGVSHTDETGGNPPSLVNQDMVLHLITDDIYIDIKFLSWSSGGSGGGFSYERSTDQNLSTNEFASSHSVKLFPNPSNDFIQFSGLSKKENYAIYNIIGTKITNGKVFNDEKVDVLNLTKGLYFLKFDNGNTIKFIKE